MSGNLGLPIPNQWIDLQTGGPTPAFFQLIRGLYLRTGGQSAPTASGGATGLTALQQEINVLDAQVSALEGSLVELYEVPDVAQTSQFLLWEAPADLAVASSVTVSFKAGGTGASDTFFTATAPVQVLKIYGRLNTANVLAAGLQVVKVPSGTAVASGTACGSAMALAGTANTVQDLGAPGVFLAPGDSLGLLGTGTIVAATGSISVLLGAL